VNAVGWIAAAYCAAGWLTTMALTVRWLELKDRAAREAVARLEQQERRHLKQVEAWHEELDEAQTMQLIMGEMLRKNRGGPLQ
jgi:hypothetical protein